MDLSACRLKVWLLLFKSPHQRADGCHKREQDGYDTETAVFVVSLAILRFYIDDVILLQVEAGRVEDILAAQVMNEHLAFVAFFTDHGHAVDPGFGSQVSGIGNCFQQRDAVTVAGKGSVASYGSQYGVFEVQDINGDKGILDVVACLDLILNQRFYWLTDIPST